MDLMISSLLCFIRVLIIISTVDLSHVSFISSPIFHPSLTHLLLSWWSPNNGQQIKGTPAPMLSKIEFQPLWVKNPPTAEWARTSSCGAQSTTNPLSFVASSSSIGIMSSPFTPSIISPRITNKNDMPLLIRPYQISNN
ncbi:hypothetical protein ACB098_09G142200 [Castanea mollissima]